MSFEIDFEPIGRRITVIDGTVLDAARSGGIVINATCGGEGTCGRCLVRVMSGEVSEITSLEQDKISSTDLAEGWRFACQTRAKSDSVIHIPPGSLATSQRIQTEGGHQPIEINPAVKSYQVILDPPSLEDLRSDADRIRDALGKPELDFHHRVLSTLSGDIRDYQFQITVFTHGSTVIGIRPAGTKALGLAVDLGTTKLAGYLIDLESGDLLASSGVMNPQIAYGEDLMSRIGHAIQTKDGKKQLQDAVIGAINDLTAELCSQASEFSSNISDAVIVGNTAMHHLFFGLPVKQLGLAPYIAAEASSLTVDAAELGLPFMEGAKVHSLPNIAGFVGADHVAMLLGSGMLEMEGNVLGLDIGTNTELSLISKGNHFACSTASGPAFEGAHIKHGMRAAPGAIEKVHIQGEKVMLQMIDDQPPVGLCGSGILDLVAQLSGNGFITNRGAFNGKLATDRIMDGPDGPEFVLVPAEENYGTEITFNRGDINQIQLAKGAIRTGIDILLKKAGLKESDLDAVVIAGAFGTYLDIESGIQIGMFPKIPRDRYQQVGNAAGTGARICLLSKQRRELASRVAKKVDFVELTIEQDFNRLFAKNLRISSSD